MKPVAVAAVEDGRTIRLADGRRLRPAGVESFALLGLGAEAAEAALGRALAGRARGEVRFRYAGPRPDRYGRRAADVFTADGRPLSALLTGAGAAVARPEPGSRCTAAVLAAEDAARAGGLGFWKTARVLPALPDALSSHLDRYVLAEGVVRSVGVRKRRTYLNFGSDWSRDVTVEIDARHVRRFGGAAALRALKGMRVRVRGRSTARGGPMLRVDTPGQIEALGRRNGE